MITIFEQQDLIEASGLFDANFYIEQNPDIAQAAMDPLEHYLQVGGLERRDPSSEFDTAFYLEQCQKQGLSVENPLLHYLLEGRDLGLVHSREGKRRRKSSSKSQSKSNTAPGLEEADQAALQLISDSGLFDSGYYSAAYGLDFQSEMAALEDFYFKGALEGRRPNFYFDPAWYLGRNPDLREAGVHPLLHYVMGGDREGRQPSLMFDPKWYRDFYKIAPDQIALSHFLIHRTTCKYSPLPDFDIEYYGEANKDVKDAGIDPVEHFFEGGFREGRNPSSSFDIREYAKEHLSGSLQSNPFVHFLESKLGFVGEISTAGSSFPSMAESGSGEEPPADSSGEIVQRILDSGLFNYKYYSAAYGLDFQNEKAAVSHFLSHGSLEGKRPNYYFDPKWYLEKNPDVRDAGVNPLHHYVAAGDFENRWPSAFFNTEWYRVTYNIPNDQIALAHYLEHRLDYRFSPVSEFDVEFYANNNPDVTIAGVDLFEHFLQGGYLESRNPSPSFNLKYYAKRYLDGDLSRNPFLHYLENKNKGGFRGVPGEDENYHSAAVRSFTSPGSLFEDYKPLSEACPRKAKLLAYYLPQFHAFEENEQFWGKGFTEWTNIARGVSRFKGHYQPRVPRDLGFYSLDNALPIMRRQVELAKGAGLFGFIFYYYWFNGQRLMERPVEQFLTDRTIAMPFCLMWANENWTRRWDGADNEVLISQNYYQEDDEVLIEDFVRHFKDPRYIRIDGRPVLMIYRPGIIPNASESVARWRKIFSDKFNENPIIVMAQTSDDIDPTDYGMDGAIEFPPHKVTNDLENINGKVENLDFDFSGNIYSYDSVVSRSLNETRAPFPLIRTVVPSWDNDARRQGAGLVFSGSTPEKYESWLRELINRASENSFFGEQIVCINAWNEWGEAAYLEPDLYYGSAYLNATARAVAGTEPDLDECKIILIGHDAFPSGAQHLLLNIARNLKGAYGVQVEFLLLGKGQLESEYLKTAPISFASKDKDLRSKLEALKSRGYSSAIVNTTASGWVLPHLVELGIDAVTLVHELPRIVQDKGLQAGAKLALELSRHVVFPSTIVREQLAASLGVALDDRMSVRPQGLYKDLRHSDEGVNALRNELGIDPGEKFVLGIGYADMRKGFDLFLQLWRHLNFKAEKRTHCCWIGDIDPKLSSWLGSEIDAAQKTGTFHCVGYRENIDSYIFLADAFALTSREDPFPTVALEALSAGVEVFAFEGSGGIPEILSSHNLGAVVPYCDVVAMALAINMSLETRTSPKDVKRRKDFVSTKLNFGDYVRHLLGLALPRVSSVSVAVPNFNYARFIPKRLETIFTQSYPVHEVIVLDDHSTDESIEIIGKTIDASGRKVKIITNDKNSGSVFAQWHKAVQAATGEFIWIAEADDLSEPDFIKFIVNAMRADPKICIGFSDSQSINNDGSHLWDSYKKYYTEHKPDALSKSEIYDGKDFIRSFLSVRNLILNVSSVIWRREALLKALKSCEAELNDFKLAGDWRIYLEVLSKPNTRVAYISTPYNIHRRHDKGVTRSLDADKHVSEIARCHEIASKYVKLNLFAKNRQKTYLREIREQLTGEHRSEGERSSDMTMAGVDVKSLPVHQIMDAIPQLNISADIKQRSRYQQFPGKLRYKPGRPHVLLVAHAAAEHLFGSERSFLDMLDGLNHADVNVIVALPRNAPTYTNEIRKKSAAVVAFNYGWWRKGEVISPESTQLFEQVIRELDISVVHCNTIMLREPYVAARNCKVPSVVHVRELITEDEALTNLIGLTPEEVVKETFKNFDWVICNSKSTAEVFNKPGRTFVINNTIDTDKFKAAPNHLDKVVRFGLISSNIAKKGLQDVVELAMAVEKTCPNAEFLLIGPITEPVQKLIALQEQGKIPASVKFPGYAESPLDAIKKVNVVLNFSHFAESFGRTVLEAMAACRPVIAYEHGAIPELIRHKVSGYLVPFKCPQLAAPYVKELCENPDKIQLFGKSGQEVAQRLYGLESYRKQFRNAYVPILAEAIAVKSDKGFKVDTSAGPVVKPARLQNINELKSPPKVAYFCWHFPVPSETFVLNELEVLVRENVDVVVFCREIPYKDFKLGFNIKFERVDSVDTLAKKLVETGRTIVHAHFVYPTVTDMVWPACEKAGIPFTFIAHAQDIFKYENDRNNRLAEIGASPLCKKLFTLSRYHLDFAVSRGFPRNKISINPNAVKVDAFVKSQVPGRELRKTRRIIAIHRFVPKKGLDILIRAAAHLKDLDVRIEIYGYGELEAEYKKIVSELKLKNVFIHGALSQEQVAAEMRNADLFACPAVRIETGDMDGLPTSIVESMAAGIPVLTTAVGALPELVVDGITGIVAEPTPEQVAAAIRRFYAMPNGQVRSIIKTAAARATYAHDAERLVRNLLRVWENRVVDIVVVSWNNLEELRGVVQCILDNTASPYHLIVCDNQSEREPVPQYLDALWEREERVTVVHNSSNAMVGPGTNLAMAQGKGDVVIYVCGKEGFSFANGWERPFVNNLHENPKVGQTGTLCRSPTYMTGKDYPKGISLFDKFRNKEFAVNNPDRGFSHVQGGLFAMRRSMIDQIGGFSDEVPHSYTDVEFSYYVESMGWELGEVPGILALFNKTRPSLSQRFDENLLVAHPVMLDEIPVFKKLIAGKLHHCNMCNWFGESFSNDRSCPECNSSPEDRSLYCWLSQTFFMYQRLPTLSVGLAGAMEQIWASQFQGPRLSAADFLENLKIKGRLPNRDGGMWIVFLRLNEIGEKDALMIMKEVRRLLRKDGVVILQYSEQDNDETGKEESFVKAAKIVATGAGIKLHEYASRAVGYSSSPVIEINWPL